MATPKRRVRRGAGLFLGVMTALTSVPPVQAAVPTVALGEISTHVVRPDVDLSAVLRSAVLSQLETLDAPHGHRGPVILSAALVRMETDGDRVTCVVSATLRTVRGGTMIAMVEGRVGVETHAPLTLPLVRQAIEAAARAALVRVPEALK